MSRDILAGYSLGIPNIFRVFFGYTKRMSSHKVLAGCFDPLAVKACIYRALLRIYRAFLRIYRALLLIYRALLQMRIYRALLRIYRALLLT